MICRMAGFAVSSIENDNIGTIMLIILGDF
jgi:hypothetical protein